MMMMMMMTVVRSPIFSLGTTFVLIWKLQLLTLAVYWNYIKSVIQERINICIHKRKQNHGRKRKRSITKDALAYIHWKHRPTLTETDSYRN